MTVHDDSGAYRSAHERAAPMRPGRSGPLVDVRVVDLTQALAGPFCTMILGDLGADVVVVHDPRPAGGRRAEAAGAAVERPQMAWRGTAHDALGRNKRSIGLDLKDDGARALFHRLVERADVLVEEFRPGTVARLGADYETVSALNPRLVYCSVTGYGQNGPYARLAGHDHLALVPATAALLAAVLPLVLQESPV